MHVVIIFVNLGPYHLARLRAAQEHCASLGWRLTAVQVTDDTLEHPWGNVSPGAIPPIITLIPRERWRDSVRSAAFGQAANRALRETLERLDPTVVFLPGWALPVARAGLHWCATHDVATVVMSESKIDDAPRSRWRESVKRWLVQHASAGLVGGRPHHDYLVSLGMDPAAIFMGYDVVDNAYFDHSSRVVQASAAAHEARIGLQAKRYFLASSRMIPKKNLFRLIDAFALYRAGAGEKAWRLVILGDGEQREALESRRDELRLGESVKFPGFLGYEELPSYYALAGAFVHASTVEQWGLVVNEAMASGVPVVVSSTCGCVPDLVSPGENGFVFSPTDVVSIATQLSRVAQLPAATLSAMGEASRQIITQWSPARFAEGLVNSAKAGQERRAQASRGSRVLLSLATRG